MYSSRSNPKLAVRPIGLELLKSCIRICGNGSVHQLWVCAHIGVRVRLLVCTETFLALILILRDQLLRQHQNPSVLVGRTWYVGWTEPVDVNITLLASGGLSINLIKPIPTFSTYLLCWQLAMFRYCRIIWISSMSQYRQGGICTE